MRVLVTGATGFIGRALLDKLFLKTDVTPIAVIRRESVEFDKVDAISVPSIDGETNWYGMLKNIQVVVHAAARVHVMRDKLSDTLSLYREINVDGTLNLARNSANAGVKRFIYISTIKVNGEETFVDGRFKETDQPHPNDPYAVSKLEAEQGLMYIAKQTGMEVVIIRPPLVYGPGVKANFLSMMFWLYRGVPLPFGTINNKRSLVALDNLVDLIMTCIEHPAAANQIFLVSDGEDMSTTELLRHVAVAMSKPVMLFPVPHKILEFSLKILGKSVLAQRLCGSLQVDISKAKKLLNWSPPIRVEAALKSTVDDYLKNIA